MKWSLLAGLALASTVTAHALASPAEHPAASLDDPVCTPAQMPLEGRASPYDSAMVSLGDGQVKVCYGRPAARGRTMIGGEAVPFGQPWRAGANEPTTLHTTVALDVGGIEVEPGAYSIYVIPGADEWEFILNRAVDRWGIPINDDVRGQDVGAVTLPRERPSSHVETMEIRFDPPQQGSASLILEWENFRISVPVSAGTS